MKVQNIKVIRDLSKILQTVPTRSGNTDSNTFIKHDHWRRDPIKIFFFSSADIEIHTLRGSPK